MRQWQLGLWSFKQSSLLGTIKRPLYYSGDTAAEQQNGQGINAFGALWYVVGPAGRMVTGASS